VYVEPCFGHPLFALCRPLLLLFPCLLPPNSRVKVVEFDAERVTHKVREDMKPFLANPDYNEARAAKGTKAAGPLVKWAIAV
jgi:hypothetical protein